MNLTKKLLIIVFSVNTTLASTAVITGTYIPVAQAQYDPNYVLDAQNLVFNGGFELDPLVDPHNPNTTNPNVTGWTKFGDAMDTTLSKISNFPHSGNQGLSLGGFVDLSYISQTLSTQPGQTYELTYYLASIDEAPDLDNEFQTFIGGNKIFDQKNISYQPYTPYKFDFTADASSTELKFGNVDKYGFLHLDDVSVIVVPEPSSIGAIAIAGLLGIWLKKKKAIS
ncbi:MAG: DUF642 domain-containing protein [Nostoc sp.]|uniref:DUF642 domain-containing protein n=1 Tax=Nostoc sp. TaxID=1180 RepID=UPI002FF455A3